MHQAVNTQLGQGFKVCSNFPSSSAHVKRLRAWQAAQSHTASHCLNTGTDSSYHTTSTSNSGHSSTSPLPCGHVSRRAALLGSSTAMLCSAVGLLSMPGAAHAALVQFPANELRNRYFLVRAGESYADAAGTVSRNPVWKTSQRYGLNRAGVRQVLDITLPALAAAGVSEEEGCWIWPSIWSSAYMTAEILASELSVGRTRIVPEYSFLDARGLGALEGAPLADALGQVEQADSVDLLWAPPHGEDGTPHESIADLLVRVRQVLSITETQYRGEDILFIAPEPDTLSVLQAAVLGVDLRQHHMFSLPPGGVRQLALSTQSFDTKPRRLACARPPACL